MHKRITIQNQINFSQVLTIDFVNKKAKECYIAPNSSASRDILMRANIYIVENINLLKREI